MGLSSRGEGSKRSIAKQSERDDFREPGRRTRILYSRFALSHKNLKAGPVDQYFHQIFKLHHYFGHENLGVASYSCTIKHFEELIFRFCNIIVYMRIYAYICLFINKSGICRGKSIQFLCIVHLTITKYNKLSFILHKILRQNRLLLISTPRKFVLQ